MEKLHGIKGVFLDLGGTLLYPPSGRWTFSELAYSYFPENRLSEPKAKESLKESDRIFLENHRIDSMEEEYELFYGCYARLAEALELGLGPDEIEAVTKDKIYNKADNYRLFDDTVPALEAMSGRYKLGIISDTWPSILPVLEELDILKYFDCVTYSYKLGVYKPDSRMYQDALGKMGLPANETVFVDDLCRNLLGAREHGINPVLIRADSPLPKSDEPVPEGIPVINKISGLLELLDQGG